MKKKTEYCLQYGVDRKQYHQVILNLYKTKTKFKNIVFPSLVGSIVSHKCHSLTDTRASVTSERVTEATNAANDLIFFLPYKLKKKNCNLPKRWKDTEKNKSIIEQWMKKKCIFRIGVFEFDIFLRYFFRNSINFVRSFSQNNSLKYTNQKTQKKCLKHTHTHTTKPSKVDFLHK